MKVSKESITLIHQLYNSPAFMAALKEICEAEKTRKVESTRANIRAGQLNLAMVSEAETNAIQEFPLIFKKYADLNGRK